MIGEGVIFGIALSWDDFVQGRAGSLVSVVVEPPWASVMAALGVAGMLGVALWILMLRRLLAEKTAVIRHQLRREIFLERFLRDVFDHSNDMLFALDAAGVIQDVNRAAALVLGRNHDEVVGLPLASFVEVDAQRALEQHFRLLKAQQQYVTFELGVKVADGGLRVLEVSMHAGGGANESERYIAIGRDVTATRRGVREERLLARLSQQLNLAEDVTELGWSALEALETGFDWDWLVVLEPVREGQPTRVLLRAAGEPECAEVLPSSPAGLMPKPGLLAWFKGGIQAVGVAEAWREVAPWMPADAVSPRAGSALVVPIRHGPHSLGLLVLFDKAGDGCTPEVMELAGRFGAILGAALHRLKAEEALRLSEERFERVFHSSPVGIAVLGLSDDRLMDANPAFLHLLGRSREEAIGCTSIDLGWWESAEDRLEVISLLEQESAVRSRECRIRDLKGSVYDTLLSIERVDLNGRPCALILAQDVTDRLRLQRQLLQSQKMEAIGQLAAGVAHDFNNLITVIQGHSGILESELEESCSLRESVAEISEAARRATDLTRQLLAFSRKQVMRPALQDCNAVLSGTTKMLGRLLGEDIEVQLELEPLLPAVQADAGMLEQVLMNLALNARDAMPKGGQLRLSTRLTECGEEVRARHPEARPGRFVTLEVADNGEGMSPETLKRIFEPFFTTKQPGKGTGLGLATVYGIVSQHRGWVEVESHIGRGTKFAIHLPASSVRVSPKSQPPEHLAPPHGKECILWVEDEESVRRFGENLLRRCGYHVLTAANGREALRVWTERTQSIQLLLTDLVMPGGLSGNELAERLKREDAGLRVIFTSGYSCARVCPDLRLDEGANFLAKPFEAVALAQLVRQVLDRPVAA